jgi:hypothetical protein
VKKLAQLKCRDCGEMFTEVPGKRGYRNQCVPCSEKQAEPERIGGNMVWDHKTAPYIELKPLSQARAFAEASMPATAIRGDRRGRPQYQY